LSNFVNTNPVFLIKQLALFELSETKSDIV
jgi:hypothetical protein